MTKMAFLQEAESTKDIKCSFFFAVQSAFVILHSRSTETAFSK